MKLWIQTLIIWGGTLCLAWGSYESNDDQLLHMRGKAFVHTVELLQQVKTKTSEPPSANVPVKTVSLRLPDHVALPLASYNLRCPVSATGEITRCCAIVFKEPEKAKMSSEVILTCRTEGMAGIFPSSPLAVKYPRQELFPDSKKAVMSLAFRRTEVDMKLPTPVFLSSSHGTFITPVDIVRTSGFEVRRNMTGAPLLAYPDLQEITIMAKPVSATVEITRCCAIVFREPEKAKISSEVFLTCRTEDMAEAGSGKPLTLKGLQKELSVSLPSVVTLAFLKTEIDPLSTTTILPADNVRPPINLVHTKDYFDGISAGSLQITPLSINAESVLRAWDSNSLASISSAPAIELNRAAFHDASPSANPILVSYHPEDMSDSISSTNNTLPGFKICRTSPDASLPELNEIIIAAKPVAPENSAQSPIRLICADSLSGGVSENDLQIDPLRVDAESVLHAWASGALICVPPALELNVAAFQNVVPSMNPILVSCHSTDLFVGAAPVRLNSLKTAEDFSMEIRRIMFTTNATKTAIQPPCALVLHQSGLLPPQTIDRMLISGIIDEVRSGRINKRNPEIRAQLIQFLQDNPFGPTSQEVFSMILENFPGNALRRKIAALQVWAQEYAGGRYTPVLGYHIMHQFYRNKDYDAAIQFAESFLEKTKEYNDRVYFLQALCYAQKNKTTAALNVLQKIQHDFPESPMAPESVFLYAWIFYEDGNLAEAKTILNELIAKYPNSASADKATKLLDAINQKISLTALKP